MNIFKHIYVKNENIIIFNSRDQLEIDAIRNSF